MSERRRLSDKIIAAHKLSCNEGNRPIAVLLLEALEIDLTAIGGDLEEKRERTEAVEAAFDLHEKTFGSLKIEGV